jgi:hypothetical protein
MKSLDKKQIEEICKCLLTYDREIVEIVQFGSSVYAPKYAKDIDLLIFTNSNKKVTDYIDFLTDLDLPCNFDVIVKGVGETLNNRLACNILGAYDIIYGSGKWIQKAAAGIDPTFEDAYKTLRDSKITLDLSRGNYNEHDWLIRTSFNGLFDAARVASMAYLSIENVRWGTVKKKLPSPYRKEFQMFINILHVKYFYNGDYPKRKVRREFDKWYKRVERYINALKKNAHSLKK